MVINMVVISQGGDGTKRYFSFVIFGIGSLNGSSGGDGGSVR